MKNVRQLGNVLHSVSVKRQRELANNLTIIYQYIDSLKSFERDKDSETRQQIHKTLNELRKNMREMELGVKILKKNIKAFNNK